MRLLKIIIFFAVIIIAIYFIYNYSSKQPAEIVEIYPDKTATKIKPNNSDDIVIKNAKSLLYDNFKANKKSGNKKATLLPEPEAPIDTRSSEHEMGDPLNTIFSTFDNTSLHEETNTVQNTTLKVVQIENNVHNLNIVQKIDNKTNGYKLQLASVKTQNMAVKEWDRIKKMYPKILSNAVVTFKKVNHENGNFFYLVIVGNYETLSQAKAVCKKLSLRQQSCIVTR